MFTWFTNCNYLDCIIINKLLSIILLIMDKQEYLENITQGELLTIIKYGLKNVDAPSDVTVEDIYYLIQSNPL